MAPRKIPSGILTAALALASAAGLSTSCSSSDENPKPSTTFTSGASGGGGQGGGGAGGEGGAGGNADCDGPGGCYDCRPTQSAHFLNACTDAQCSPFDNVKRLPLYDGGDLPPIP